MSQLQPAFLKPIVLLLTVAINTAYPHDWPTHRGNSARHARSQQTIEVESLGLAWKRTSMRPPRPAWSRPARWDAYANIRDLQSMRDYDRAFPLVVVGEQLFLSSSVDDSLHCLSTRTGKRLWSVTTDGPIRTAATVENGLVYFGSDDGHVRCVRVENGELVWSFPPLPSVEPTAELSPRILPNVQPANWPEELTDRAQQPKLVHNGRFISRWPCRTGVLVHQGIAYFACSLFPWNRSYFFAVDAQTGKLTAPNHFVRSFSGRTFEAPFSIVEADGQAEIIAPQGRVAPLRIATRTGKILNSLGGGGGSKLMTLGNQIWHGPGNKTGWMNLSRLTDKKPVRIFTGMTDAAATGTGVILSGSTDLMCLDQHAAVRWKIEQPDCFCVAAAANVVFTGHQERIRAVDLATGELRWSANTSGRVCHLVIANNAVFASTDTGIIACFRPGASPRNAARTPEDTRRKQREAQVVEGIATPNRSRRSLNTRTENRAATGLLDCWIPDASAADRLRRRGIPHPEKRLANRASGRDALATRQLEIQPRGAIDVLSLNGKTRLTVAEPASTTTLPREQITVEAWVKIDQPQTWGGIVGVIEDNGNDETGWLLGYRGSKFCFAVRSAAGPGRLTYLTAPEDFEPGRWHHVAGVYDGKQQKLFVDGRVVGKSTEQSGPLVYAPHAVYELAAYHDRDEHFPLIGKLYQVCVWNRGLDTEEIEKKFLRHRDDFPRSTQVRVGPFLEFVEPGIAEVRWQTASPQESRLIYAASKTTPPRTVLDKRKKLNHSLRIEDLPFQSLGWYQIEISHQGQQLQTERFELDTHFDYRLPTQTSTQLSGCSLKLKEYANTPRGLLLVIGLENGNLLKSLATNTQYQIIGVDDDRQRVRRIRNSMLQPFIPRKSRELDEYRPRLSYGNRVVIHFVEDLRKLPFDNQTVNVLLSERPNDLLGIDEYLRLVRPDGGQVLLHDLSEDIRQNWLNILRRKQWEISTDQNSETWLIAEKPRLAGVGDWSHLYGRPDNTGFAGETLAGATSVPELKVQWFGEPGPRAQPDRSGRKPSPLSAGGRLFIQGLKRVIAVDAYNGSLLWSLEIPHLERFNIPRDCNNWCADEDNVYLAVRDRCWQIEAATGRVKKFHPVEYEKTTKTTLADPHIAAENSAGDMSSGWDWGYIASSRGMLIGSSVKQGAVYTNYWGDANAGWYDAPKGPATYKVLSDSLFAIDPKSGQRLWSYRDQDSGLILNCSITLSGGRGYFLVCQNKSITAKPARRVGGRELWQNTSMACLELSSGQLIWQTPVDLPPGKALFALAAQDGRLISVSSDAGQFFVRAFSSQDGSPLWQRDLRWPQGKSDHGKAMSRPVLVGGKIYLRPYVLKLADGTLLDLKMPGGGCGTYCATTKTLIFRNANITLWDQSRGRQTSWPRLRPGCWLSTIPAGGMLLSPEAGGGCSCGNWLETSIGFAPRADSPTNSVTGP